MTTFIERYFNERNKMQEKWKKSMLIFQCGKFYEIYGFEDDNNDPIWDYQKIMPNCASPWKKAEFQNRNVLCCGWPVNQFFKWIHLFVPEGWKIDIWNEIGTAKKGNKIHGFFKSFSPGTFVPLQNNNIITNTCSCIWIEKSFDYVKNIPFLWCGMSVINTISGKSILYEYQYYSNCLISSSAFEEIDRFNSIHNPKEIWLIHNLNDKHINDVKNFANLHCNRLNIYSIDKPNEHDKLIKNCSFQKFHKEILNKYFSPKDPDVWFHSYGFNEYYYAVSSYCILLKFMVLHNPDLIEKLSIPDIQTLNNKLILRTHSLQQLNIIDTEMNKGPYSSVNKLTNKCKTDMGKREFKQLLVNPSNNIEYLKKEYFIINHILKKYETSIENTRKDLSKIYDIERLYRKFVLNQAEPIDIYSLYNSLTIIQNIHNVLLKDKGFNTYFKYKIKNLPTEELKTTISILKKTFKIDICKKTKKIIEESFFNRDLYEDLDQEEDNWNNINKNIQHYKDIFENILGKEDSIQLHKTDTGVFLRTTQTRAKKIMDTLKNINDNTINLTDIKITRCSESKKKFVSHDLNQLYNKYIQSSDNFIELLNCKFKQFIRKFKAQKDNINHIIKYITLIDIIFNKAFISKKYNYCKPNIKEKNKAYLNVKNLRHPLIENIQTNELYVTNDIQLGLKKNGVLLYGTNGCGKSSLIRAIGISIIMAQSGMYVPAIKFTYSPYHSIFTRILGNDNLFKGLSGFATEMSELQSIIEYSDNNSLILGDELCSGTEHPSAISIFGSGLKLLDNKNASYIFATHLHQLENVELVKNIKKLEFKHMSVIYDVEKKILIYERKLKKGRGLANYGLEVCKQYNFPKEFFENAYKIREKICNTNFIGNNSRSNYNKDKLKDYCELCHQKGLKVEGVDIHHLNPQKFADNNGWIDTIHKNHKANIINICKKCHLKVTRENTIHKITKTSNGYVLIEQ